MNIRKSSERRVKAKRIGLRPFWPNCADYSGRPPNCNGSGKAHLAMHLWRLRALTSLAKGAAAGKSCRKKPVKAKASPSQSAPSRKVVRPRQNALLRTTPRGSPSRWKASPPALSASAAKPSSADLFKSADALSSGIRTAIWSRFPKSAGSISACSRASTGCATS